MEAPDHIRQVPLLEGFVFGRLSRSSSANRSKIKSAISPFGFYLTLLPYLVPRVKPQLPGLEP